MENLNGSKISTLLFHIVPDETMIFVNIYPIYPISIFSPSSAVYYYNIDLVLRKPLLEIGLPGVGPYDDGGESNHQHEEELSGGLDAPSSIYHLHSPLTPRLFKSRLDLRSYLRHCQ